MQTLKPFEDFPAEAGKKIQYVLTDIDDTLTVDGRLPSAAFRAMERLQEAGIRMIPVTGRPAGWCDHIARMWPVDGLIGENGAFYFVYDVKARKMVRRYRKTAQERLSDRKKLDRIREEILQRVAGCRIASDQAYREADLAVDFCEDVPPLPESEVEKIVRCFEEAGAQAKVSSIHVNGWFGQYDKLSMTQIFFEEWFGQSLENIKDQVIFTGDSPNDAPMFGYFPHAVGVANVLAFRGRLDAEPAWVTQQEGGFGFAEMVERLLVSRSGNRL